MIEDLKEKKSVFKLNDVFVISSKILKVYGIKVEVHNFSAFYVSFVRL